MRIDSTLYLAMRNITSLCPTPQIAMKIPKEEIHTLTIPTIPKIPRQASPLRPIFTPYVPIRKLREDREDTCSTSTYTPFLSNNKRSQEEAFNPDDNPTSSKRLRIEITPRPKFVPITPISKKWTRENSIRLPMTPTSMKKTKNDPIPICDSPSPSPISIKRPLEPLQDVLFVPNTPAPTPVKTPSEPLETIDDVPMVLNTPAPTPVKTPSEPIEDLPIIVLNTPAPTPVKRARSNSTDSVIFVSSKRARRDSIESIIMTGEKKKKDNNWATEFTSGMEHSYPQIQSSSTMLQGIESSSAIYVPDTWEEPSNSIHHHQQQEEENPSSFYPIQNLNESSSSSFYRPFHHAESSSSIYMPSRNGETSSSLFLPSHRPDSPSATLMSIMAHQASSGMAMEPITVLDDDEFDKPPMEVPVVRRRRRRETPKRRWCLEEEIRFIAAIDVIVRRHIWMEVKGDDFMRLRGSNGVKSHWNAYHRRLVAHTR
ncbi:hypothetical protein TREMEDRAFT_73434 [Tremella mesenterica DSM 1558]|uniref:uncharacterized protein n=1 Tax=Tremella mesenterica (strain ATCC 24925 / CBS 8224 / DSM 1558 / NBRC 9311 / NRRL Y-6157 / RJB 2259-6 / UBC 559-6) TaxID=578456 RepID=UPI0003F49ED2|nr:uncharacterized protein TREMEDRAFT_73434 [Tremella mesenterica DSM 1558]EIW70343.1 hypothetical protein TREMEDRAFT_73434 [Tremella mesenterica DSM 1558]